MTKAPNDPKPRIKISLSAKNLGVFENLQHSLEADSCRIGIFANNGSGKTFISKAFAAYSERERGPSTDRLIRIDSEEAEFEFDVTATTNPAPDGKLAIKLTKVNVLSTEAISKYQFHVFNSDYVRKNLDDRGYHPDAGVTGVIVGELTIDLTNEENDLKAIEDEEQELESFLKGSVEGCKKELKECGVAANTIEYREVSYENLLSPTYTNDELENSAVLRSQLDKLSSMPDDLADVPSLGNLAQIPALENIHEYLKTQFDRSHFDDAFKSKVHEKDGFIRSGLKLLNNDTCPFCEQPLEAFAKELLDRYRQFFDDEEAKAILQATDFRRELEQLVIRVGEISTKSANANVSFNSVKSYLTTASELNFNEFPREEDLERAIDSIASALDAKKDNVGSSEVAPEVEDAFRTVELFLENLSNTIAANNLSITRINSKKNDLVSEKLAVRKRICKATFKELIATCESQVLRLAAVGGEVKALREEIAEKESGQILEKKRAVAKTFKELLETFFPNKYSFDEETFSLLFSNKSLNEGANDILSDGEKSIIGFCHYLASTHELVNSQSDYEKLFFVIDDPISSMDFHFVYKIADCIRGLNKVLPLGDRFRYLILTHNLQFISLLERNNICGNILLLSDGKLTRKSAKSTLPYDLHLKDIVEVGAGSAVKHTTSNSIRHVLESIGAFIDPGASSEKVFEEVAAVRSNAYLWTLIQDQSHGVYGQDQSLYQEDDVRNGCNVLVDYLREKFPKQIERFAPQPALPA